MSQQMVGRDIEAWTIGQLSSIETFISINSFDPSFLPSHMTDLYYNKVTNQVLFMYQMIVYFEICNWFRLKQMSL